MILVCKYNLEAYSILDQANIDYISLVNYIEEKKISPKHLENGSLKKIYSVKNLDSIESLFCILNEIELDEFKIDSVLSMGELSQYTAGFIKETLKCGGLSLDLINKTRDKRLMKSMLVKSGIPCSNYEYKIEKAMMTEYYPLVAKPVAGFGTLNTKIVNSRDELEEYIQEFHNNKDSNLISDSLIFEEFITGDEFIADVVVINSKIEFLSISKYLNPVIETTAGRCNFNAAIHLNKNNSKEIYNRVNSILININKSFGVESSSFHIEFFVTPENEIKISEIGTRPGGSYFNFLTKSVYGQSIYESWLYRLYNIKKINSIERDDDYQHVAVNLLSEKSGTIISFPSLSDLENFKSLSEIIPRKNIGDTVEENNLVDYTCYFIFKSNNETQLHDDVKRFVSEFKYDIK